MPYNLLKRELIAPITVWGLSRGWCVILSSNLALLGWAGWTGLTQQMIFNRDGICYLLKESSDMDEVTHL